MRPRFELARVKAAVAADRFSLGRTSAWLKVQPFFADMLTVRAFTRSVVDCLTDEDFSVVKILDHGEVFDEYGVALPASLLERFHLEPDLATWYLKLTMRETQTEDEVFLLSLHLLERVMVRVGGVLSPRRIRT